MSRFLIVVVVIIGGIVVLSKGDKVGGIVPTQFGGFSGQLTPHYPKDATEIKKAGGFFKLSADEQAGVRDRYVQDLEMLLEELNDQMRFAQQGTNISTIYAQRRLMERVMMSIKRAQNPSRDPTAEQEVISYVKAALSR